MRVEASDAIRCPRLSEESSAENGIDGNQRQSRIFAHKETKSIRESELLDLARLDIRRAGFFTSKRACGIERRDVDCVITEVLVRHTLDIRLRDIANQVDVVF